MPDIEKMKNANGTVVRWYGGTVFYIYIFFFLHILKFGFALFFVTLQTKNGNYQFIYSINNLLNDMNNLIKTMAVAALVSLPLTGNVGSVFDGVTYNGKASFTMENGTRSVKWLSEDRIAIEMKQPNKPTDLHAVDILERVTDGNSPLSRIASVYMMKSSVK